MPSTWSSSKEHPTHPSVHPGPSMKCLMISWLRPPKRSARVSFSFGPLEDIRLLDLDPRQRAPLGGEPIAQPGQFLFPDQELLAGSEPLVARYDRVLHRSTSFNMC